MPLLISLKTVPIATLLAFIFSLFLVWVASSKKKFLASIIEFIVSIPIFIPPTILGFYLLQILGRATWLGKLYNELFGKSFIFSPAAVIASAALAGLPYIYKSIKTFIDSIDIVLISAAEIAGASKWQIFIYILLPLSKNGVLAGILLGFLRGLGEFGITMMIAGNIEGVTRTVPLAIWDSVITGKNETAHMYSAFLAVISILIIIIFKTLERKSADQ
ncbi:MAG: ABC transporter permease subunit [Spirochaetia bacterium]|jgi:molybdate transport system permease protein|nr:ABC transporter permease subunit [Spirochaetia bacterium]